jgi:hypothetical protein
MKDDTIDRPRAKENRYIEYMLKFPYHFYDLSGQKATTQNIKKFFSKLKSEGLVAAEFCKPEWLKEDKYKEGL